LVEDTQVAVSYRPRMAEALTVFLTVQHPLGDETENAFEEAFDDLDLRLGGIGEVVGWTRSSWRMTLL
jgi:hypothetical protein